MKTVSVTYVPGRLRNLPSTRKAVEQWCKAFVYYKTKGVLGFPGKESLVLNLSPRKRLFSATGVSRTPSQGAALALAEKTAEAIRLETTGQWGPRAGVGRSSRQGAALALAAKTDEAMRNRDGPVGVLCRCQTEPEARGSAGGAGGGGERVLCDEGTPRVRGPRRGDTGGAI